MNYIAADYKPRDALKFCTVCLCVGNNSVSHECSTVKKRKSWFFPVFCTTVLILKLPPFYLSHELTFEKPHFRVNTQVLKLDQKL